MGGAAFKTLSKMGQTSVPSFWETCVELGGERIHGHLQFMTMVFGYVPLRSGGMSYCNQTLPSLREWGLGDETT